MHYAEAGNSIMDKKPAIVADLFVKSVARCVLAEAGQRIPPRQVPLAPSTPRSSWADRSADTDIDREILVWIASHVHGKKRPRSTLT